MNYIIFDLEWNQPPEEAAAVQSPVHLTGEIVEIGAVKLDEHFSLIDELRLYITPKYYTKMHRKVASLTGIRDQDLKDRGKPFPDAYREFAAWCGEEYTYMTWSMSDLPMLLDNMQLHGLDTSNLPDCCDVQRIFAREIMRQDRRYALDDALAILSETGDTAHDALHDAKNTAIVCNHLNLEEYLDEYVFRVFAEAPIPESFPSRREILDWVPLRQCRCPWCGQEFLGEPWLSFDRESCVSCSTCPEGDEFLLHLTVEPSIHGSFRVKRLLFEMSDDWWDLYCDRKDAVSAQN